MRKIIVVLFVVCLMILFFGENVFSGEITWEDISKGIPKLKTVLIHPDNPRIIYLGSNNAILKTEDQGLTWRNVLLIKGQNRAVNFLSFSSEDKDSLYAATGNGVFYSKNQGKTWKRIFRGKDDFENDCSAVAAIAGNIYLGTKRGLFISKDSGRSWYKQPGKLGNSCIFAIALDKVDCDYAYVASSGGVFKSKNRGESWERCFVVSRSEEESLPEENTDDGDEEGNFPGIACIAIDNNKRNELYLATVKGVYQSKDSGLSWDLLSNYGLLDREIKFVLTSPDAAIFAATKSGIFEFKDGRWHELSLSLAAEDTAFLSFDNKGNLYAVSDKGLFKACYRRNNEKDSLASLYSKDEPEINRVLEAAIKYAEVEPEKIILWRKQAAKKAFFPKVSAGVNRDTSDLWHWESGSTTKTGDDVLVRGRETIGWDIALTWDLGEIIWNNDQTSIDVRSRLMVELREDILDQVTKLYFERLRLKLEIENLSIEDRKKRLEGELRLRELSAMLDALTGGYFSRAVRN